jgi:DNA primase
VHHLQRLSRYTSDITFCFDGDQAGRTAAWRALLVTLPMMRDDLQVRFMFLPEGEDPDTLIRKEGKEHFEERAQAALSLSSFFFQSLSAQANLSSMDGRARFVSLASGHLKQLPEGVFQKMMYEELAKRAKTDITQLIQKKKPPYYGRRAIPRARPPSALRSAITLLVQEPALAWQITNPLPPLTISGGAFLIELVENIKKNSLAHTGAVLEHWRDQKERSLLEKLAQLEHIVPENGIKNEFLGAIDQIKKLSYDQQIEDLLAKASKDGLSPEEKEHLYQLIHTKKQTAVETG